jgi:hypothetical protein
VIISTVAIAVFAIRRGGLHWVEAKGIVRLYWPVGLAVFFGLLIWDTWFQRTKRKRPIEYD